MDSRPAFWPALLAAAGLLAFALWRVAGAPGLPDAPRGCDSFGYQRQAALFRAEGVRGLDTRLETPVARRLIAGMLESGQPVADWYQAVAPHCHHYKASVDRVVIQYPPGAGLLLAAFPEAIQSRALLVAGILGIAAAFAGLAAGGRSIPGVLASAAAGMVVIAATWVGGDSESVAPATLLAVLAGIALGPCLAARGALPMALLGLLVGLSTAVRLANLLLALGPAAVSVGRLAVDRRRGRVESAVGLAAGLLVGLVPVLAADLVNAGSPLSTTYSPIDASAPRIGWAAVLRGLHFYLAATAPGLLLATSLLAAGLVLWRRPSAALAAAALSMAASLAYLVPKEILITYYPTPVAAFLLATTVATGAPSRGGVRRWRIVLAAAVPLVGGALWEGATSFPRRADAVSTPVAEALAQHPVVWSDWTGGMFVLDAGAYAAKLHFTGERNQDRLLEIADKAGIPQLMTLESDTMQSIAARLRSRWTLAPLGRAYGTEVYRLAPKPPEAGVRPAPQH